VAAAAETGDLAGQVDADRSRRASPLRPAGLEPQLVEPGSGAHRTEKVCGAISM